MAAFEYQALSDRGRKRSGVIEADSERQARQLLRDQGLLPVALTNTQLPSGEQPRRRLFQRGLPHGELTLFTRQLATLLQSGLPLEEALNAIARQSDQRRLKTVVLGVRSRVLEGHSLREALAQYSQSFDPLYLAMVAAGEKSGSLAPVLIRLAEHGERQQKLRAKVQLALLYPATLTLVATGVIGLLMTYVVPKVVAQFDHLGQELPQLTRILISLSEGLQNHGINLLALILLGSLSLRGLLRSDSRRLRWHRLQLRLPLIKGFITGQQSLQFARTLGILIGSGQHLLESLYVAAQPLKNLHLRQQILGVADQVREGASLSRAMEQARCFPPMLVYMIAIGEQSGELEQMLQRAAENQEAEFETRVSWLVGLFEPILILTMGVVVLCIVLAILLPILQMNNLTVP